MKIRKDDYNSCEKKGDLFPYLFSSIITEFLAAKIERARKIYTHFPFQLLISKITFHLVFENDWLLDSFFTRIHHRISSLPLSLSHSMCTHLSFLFRNPIILGHVNNYWCHEVQGLPNSLPSKWWRPPLPSLQEVTSTFSLLIHSFKNAEIVKLIYPFIHSLSLVNMF